ncbi:MAG: hypothetical protein M0R74_10640 [Dehalococcoidia bacterium]|jgi:hypothetical protein|nr:hypothetical protein [Dehalococcoidia bacterium]
MKIEPRDLPPVACTALLGADILAKDERRSKEFSFAWLPQETAPNGVYVLVVRGKEYGVAQRAGNEGNYFESRGGDFSNQIDGWMPLPPPPPNVARVSSGAAADRLRSDDAQSAQPALLDGAAPDGNAGPRPASTEHHARSEAE